MEQTLIFFICREKGDASKAREYLPVDKQYLVTRGVPCLRRATSLAYTDADEDAERLIPFGDSSATGNEADEWVETHAGRQPTMDSAANPGDIADIPDLDGHDTDAVAGDLGKLSLGGGKATVAETPPDLDDIPDMEEDNLEDEDDAATAAGPKAAAHVAGVIDARWIPIDSATKIHSLTYSPARLKLPMEICYKCEHMTL